MDHDDTQGASDYWENEQTVDAFVFDQNPGSVMDLAARGPVTVLDERGEVCLRISLPSLDDE
jgi:hypothetical protein